MLVGTVVCHKIENQLHPPAMELLYQSVEIRQRTVIRFHGKIIHRGVTVGRHTFHNGHQPESVNSQLLEIIQLLGNLA